MSGIDARIRERVTKLTGVTGTQITYRRVTHGSGPAADMNPPNLAAGTVDVTASIGATSIAFAGGFRGRLVAGDKFTIAGDATIYTISSNVTASGGKFTGISFTPALVAQADAGDAVQLTFAADSTFTGRISSFPVNLVDGASVKATDLLVIAPGAAFLSAPTTSDRLLFGGSSYNIVSAQPQYVKDSVGLWRIQARA